MKYTIFIVLFFVFTSFLWSDMVILKDGQEFLGKILKVENGKVFLKTEDGKDISFSVEDVLKLVFHHKKGKGNVSQIDDLKDELLKNLFSQKEEFFQKYPNSAYVTLYSQTSYDFTPQRTYKVVRRNIILVLKERGKSVGNGSIVYDPTRSKAKFIWARTITPDGNIWYLDDSSLKEGIIYSSLPPYQKYKKIKYALKQVDIGSIIDVKTEVAYKKPYDLLHPFYTKVVFRGREPILKKEVRFSYPETVSLKIDKLNWKDEIRESKKKEKGKMMLSYVAEDMPEVESENFMPLYEKIFPTLVVANEFSWDNLSSKYGAVLGESSRQKKKMKEVLNKLLSGIKSKKEKMIKIYNWVVEQVRSVSVSVSLYSYRPKSPDEILTNAIANSLDKVFLTFCMLKEAGLDVSFLMVAPSDRVFTKDVPTLAQLKLPLLKVILGKETIYLAPVSQTIAWGELPSIYQGTYALNIGKKDALIYLPLNPTSKESDRMYFRIDINKNLDFTIRMEEKCKGKYARQIRSFKYVNKKNLDKEMETYVSGIHPFSKLISYKLINYKELNPIDTGMELTYQLRNYVIKGGNKLVAFKLPFLKEYSSSVVSQKVLDRKWPIELEGVWEEIHEADIYIPSGWKVSSFPDKVIFNADGLYYEGYYKYDKEKNTLHFVDKFRASKVYYPKGFYSSLKECYEKRFAFARGWIVLEKNK